MFWFLNLYSLFVCLHSVIRDCSSNSISGLVLRMGTHIYKHTGLTREHTTVSVLPLQPETPILIILRIELRSPFYIQGVPLATEPGISLIILTPMRILQRNLNSSTFVVWEMKRNVSVVRLIVGTRSSSLSASQSVSCLTRLSADLSVLWLRVPSE